MTVENFRNIFKRGSRFIAGSERPELVEEASDRLLRVADLFMEETGLYHDFDDTGRLDLIFDLPPDTSLGFDTSVALQELEEFLAAA